MVDKNILGEQWYHGLLPREDIRILLTKCGEFLVRSTEPVKGQKRQYVLSAVGDKDNLPIHFVLQESNGKVFIETRGFETISKLIEHHFGQKEAIYTKDKSSMIVLKFPVNRQPWEISHEDVTLTKKLGEGAFGEVWKGVLTFRNERTADVAIKTAKLESLNKEQIKEIMHEARIMRYLDHPNVVKFYGVGATQEPLYVIMELADGGALDSALQKNKFTIPKKLELIYQASCGVAYIHEKVLLHRDIAARNCLYGGGQVKISDFGLSREGVEYRMDLSKKVPIRWLPPETIKTGIYNQKVDVYAFGIMAWEIIEDGKEPYPGMRIIEVVSKVLSGYRMPFNSAVDKGFADFIMKRCWAENPDDRSLMKDIEAVLKKHVVKQTIFQQARSKIFKPKERKSDNKGSIILSEKKKNSGMSNSGTNNSGMKNSGMNNSGMNNSGIKSAGMKSAQFEKKRSIIRKIPQA